MAVIEKYGNKSVLEGAKQRIMNAYNSGYKISISVSGGKDSIVMMDLVYKLIQKGYINPDKVEITFIDEEAMFHDVIEIVKKWRLKFIKQGVKFYWFCLELCHYNCLNFLKNDQSFIMWDRYKKDRWVRRPPEFAIMKHPLANYRKEAYQTFLDKFNNGKVVLVGIRTDESIQRKYTFAESFMKYKGKVKFKGFLYSRVAKVYPIYDWTDNDIWLYIRENNLDFPETYLKLYQIGRRRERLRISQFFSMDSISVLYNLPEIDPDLMDKVNNREPNAYLAALYFNSDMFRRSRNEEKENTKNVDYKDKTLKKINELERQGNKSKELNHVKRIIFANRNLLDNKLWQKLHGVLVAGDPKDRALRAVYTGIGEKKKKIWSSVYKGKGEGK